jgi:hypothetical protein
MLERHVIQRRPMLERHVIQRRPTTKENSSSKHSLQENAIGHWQQPLDPSSMDLMMLKQLVNTALAKAMYAMHTSFHKPGAMAFHRDMVIPFVADLNMTR